MTLPNLLAFTVEDARRQPTSRLFRLMDASVVEVVIKALDETWYRSSAVQLRAIVEHVQTLAMDEIDRRIPVPGDPRPAWAIGPDPLR